MKSVADATVTFNDGHAEEFDGIVLGTGFELCLPFLSDDIRATISLDAVHLEICGPARCLMSSKSSGSCCRIRA